MVWRRGFRDIQANQAWDKIRNGQRALHSVNARAEIDYFIGPTSNFLVCLWKIPEGSEPRYGGPVRNEIPLYQWLAGVFCDHLAKQNIAREWFCWSHHSSSVNILFVFLQPIIRLREKGEGKFLSVRTYTTTGWLHSLSSNSVEPLLLTFEVLPVFCPRRLFSSSSFPNIGRIET